MTAQISSTVCIKTKLHSYTCWRRCKISRSCVSTLKADFSALQWIQLALHHAEGLALQKRKKSPIVRSIKQQLI